MKVLLRRVALKIEATLHSNSIFHIILIIITGLILYFNTFNNSFVWDDEYLIVKDIRIRSWENLPQIFVSSLSLPSPKQGNFYRPFQVISFLFDYSFWKLNPVGYHITNLFFHILNASLLYFLMKILLQNALISRNSKREIATLLSVARNDKSKVIARNEVTKQSNSISLLVAVLFLVHPVHTEAVTYISGRADPMVTTFCLVSLILFLEFRDFNMTHHLISPSTLPSPLEGEGERMRGRWFFYAGSIISFVCALLSKETAIIFPFLLIWCGYSLDGGLKTRLTGDYGRLKPSSKCGDLKVSVTVLHYLPFFLLAVLYVVFRLTLLKAISEPHPPIAPFYSRVITFFNVIIRYIGLLLFPQNLHMERRFPFLNSLLQPEAFLSVLFAVLLVVMVIRFRRYSTIASFGLGWFLIALLPVSNIMSINAAMAEHWLYMPSIGFFLAVAIGVSSLYGISKTRLPRSFQSLAMTPGFVIARNGVVARQSRSKLADSSLCSEQAAQSNLLWTNRTLRYMFILFIAVVLIFYSAVTIRQNQVWNDEISLFNSILKWTPDSARIYINLGVAYAKRDEYDKAITAYKKAIELYPDFVMTYINMGYMYSKKGMNEEAVRAYKAALSVRPYYVTRYISDELRLIYSDKEIAGMTFSQSSGPPLSNLELADLYNNVALIYDKEDMLSDAVRMYKKSIESNPEYADARINLGILYRKKGIYDNAFYEFNELLKIDKDSIDGHFNLGFIYDKLGRYEEALSEYREVVRISPRDVKAHNNLGTAYGKLSRHLEAIHEYKEALSIAPDFAMSHFNLGSAYANKGEMAQAVAEWEKALKLDPDLKEAKESIKKALK